MIAIKTVLFFFALIATISAIEEFIEKAIGHSKTEKDEYHMLYTTGLINTVDFWSTLFAIIFWTAFYLMNQL